LNRWARRQKKEYDKDVKGEKSNTDEAEKGDLGSIGLFDVYVIIKTQNHNKKTII